MGSATADDRVVGDDEFWLGGNPLVVDQAIASRAEGYERVCARDAELVVLDPGEDGVVWSRINDAIAPYAGIDYKNFVIGLSYDANASKLRSLTKNVNSFELTLSYIKRSGTRSIVDFVRCARL